MSLLNLVKHCKKLTDREGQLLPDAKALDEYPFMLEGYYFCAQTTSTIVVMRLHYKRMTLQMPVMDIVADKELIQELSPIDACLIGVLANSERNGIYETTHDSVQNMNRLKNHHCCVKFEPLLQVTKTYFNQYGHEMTGLYSTLLHKEVEIPTTDLLNNQAILYSLAPLQALSVGYNASESWLREHLIG